jgi:hypothetical protein
MWKQILNSVKIKEHLGLLATRQHKSNFFGVTFFPSIFVVRARREQEVAGPRVGENYHSPKRGSITMSWSRQRLVVVV